jgi:uncharacterized protein with PIN domain
MLISVCLEVVLFLTQDRCMVCAERTTSSKIALDTTDRTSRWVMWNLISVRLERVFVLEQGRCTACAEHTISLKIVLDTR